MRGSDIKRWRAKAKIDLLEIAAFTGLPRDYIERLEDEEALPMEKDLERLKDAIQRISKQHKKAEKQDKGEFPDVAEEDKKPLTDWDFE